MAVETVMGGWKEVMVRRGKEAGAATGVMCPEAEEESWAARAAVDIVTTMPTLIGSRCIVVVTAWSAG